MRTPFPFLNFIILNVKMMIMTIMMIMVLTMMRQGPLFPFVTFFPAARSTWGIYYTQSLQNTSSSSSHHFEVHKVLLEHLRAPKLWAWLSHLPELCEIIMFKTLTYENHILIPLGFKWCCGMKLELKFILLWALLHLFHHKCMNQKVVELQNIMQELQSSAKRLFFSLNRSAARIPSDAIHIWQTKRQKDKKTKRQKDKKTKEQKDKKTKRQ